MHLTGSFGIYYLHLQQRKRQVMHCLSMATDMLPYLLYASGEKLTAAELLHSFTCHLPTFCHSCMPPPAAVNKHLPQICQHPVALQLLLGSECRYTVSNYNCFVLSSYPSSHCLPCPWSVLCKVSKYAIRYT